MAEEIVNTEQIDMAQPLVNPIYDFLKKNNLTDKDESSFTKEYSDPNKLKELYGFFQQNKLTDKDYNTFSSEYFGAKKKRTKFFRWISNIWSAIRSYPTD